MRSILRQLAHWTLAPFFFVFFVILCLSTSTGRCSKQLPRLLFGCIPLINNKYWAGALREAGYKSSTLMKGYYSINKKEDFDKYFDDFKITKIPFIDNVLCHYLAFAYAVLNFDIVHLSFDGGLLTSTALACQEMRFYKLAGMKVVALPYGADFHQYSTITDLSWRHALLINYPELARQEDDTHRNINRYNRHADCIMLGQMLDGAARWDLLPVNFLTIDESMWTQKSTYSHADGISQSVKIIHTPNHRGVKGTEFICRAIEELQQEGLKIDFLLMEKIPNDKVAEVMRNADILVEQLIFPGYGLSAVEGMASGLPVMSNLQGPYEALFRRYSYLNECPIFSTSVETIKQHLRHLITHPALREELGHKGRSYVEKYNSKLSAQLTFGRIYQKIWHKENIDLINYFHPLIGRYGHDYSCALQSQHKRVPECQHA